MNRAQTARKTHCQASKLVLKNPEYRKWVIQYTIDEYSKDVGTGDITTQAYFDKEQTTQAHIIVKENGILAGVAEIKFFIGHFKNIRMRFLKKDGDAVRTGEIIAYLSGSVFDLMKTERVILNLIGRMSGVATFTNQFVRAARKINTHVLITPTRKTLWGLLDKRACVLGGGGTHRLALDNAILIKHNHLKASGVSIGNYLKRVVTRAKGEFLEIEVRNAQSALEATKAFIKAKKEGLRLPCFIMFDNMKPTEIGNAILIMKRAKLYKDILFEASGRINQKTLPAFVRTGVDVLSVGAVTHSAPMLDLSMRID